MRNMIIMAFMLFSVIACDQNNTKNMDDKEQIVTVSEKATQEYKAGTTIWLKPGEKIRVIDLVYGAMMESGNDAAYALGEAVAGSEADFAFS